MATASSFLYHFTSGKLNAIKGILQTGFRIMYSDEAEYITTDEGHLVKFRKAIPMACFCDLPLSDIRNHAEFYSNSKSEIFGLGMTKEWAQQYRLNPIIYVAPGSYMMNLFNNLNNYLLQNTVKAVALDVFWSNNLEKIKDLPYFGNLNNLIENDDYINNFNAIEGFFPLFDKEIRGGYTTFTRFELFYKPTWGMYIRNGVEIPNHPYYFEREWRHIPYTLPQIMCCREHTEMNEQELIVKRNYDAFIESKKYFGNLEFQPHDIDQIIVDSQESSDSLISFLLSKEFSHLCGKQILDDTQRNLLSKKITIWNKNTPDR